MNIVNHDLDLHLPGHRFWNGNIWKAVRAGEKCSKLTLYRGWYLPSNGTIMNIVICDIDLSFIGQTFQAAILTNKGWKIQTLLLPSDKMSGICHWLAPLWMLFIMTLIYIDWHHCECCSLWPWPTLIGTTVNVVHHDLDLHFQITNFEIWISKKLWELVKNGWVLLLWMLMVAFEWYHCACCSQFSVTLI